jgi:hypothetical protein
VEPASHPVFDIRALAPRGGSHQGPKESFGVRLERGGGVLAELGGRGPPAPRNPSADPFHQRIARTAGLAEYLAFNNVVGHDV